MRRIRYQCHRWMSR